MSDKQAHDVALSEVGTTPNTANIAPPDNTEDDSGYPEGGVKAWSVVLGAWCAMIPSMGLLNSLGVLHAWTGNHQLKDYSESSIGWIFGAYGFFLYLAGAQAGPLFDAYGPKYVVIPGSVGLVGALVCFSFSQGMRSDFCAGRVYDLFLTACRILPDLSLL